MNGVREVPEVTEPYKHISYMQLAIQAAKSSPPRPTNFCVGAVLVDAHMDTILATGWTLECEGNTHAEQCCFIKYAARLQIPEEQLIDELPADTALYTTMEPCCTRLSENQSCVEIILGLRRKLKTVYVGVLEPPKFVCGNSGIMTLEAAGVRVFKIPGFEVEILEIATAGHVEEEEST